MKRSTKRTVPAQRSASRRSGAMSIRGMPTTQSSAPSIRANGLEQHVDALVRAHEAEAQDHRALDRGELGRQRSLVRLLGEVGEGAVGDRVHAAGVGEQRAQLGGAVLGVGDDGVHAREQRPLARAARARDVGQRVVDGERARALGQQEAVEVGHAQPLQVDDVGGARVDAQAAHPRHVLGEAQAPAAGASRPRRVERR